MGRHRRSEVAVLEAVSQYELLVRALHDHRPGDRSGLCLVCGTGWPCAEVWLPFQPQR
jgi:hypothetical protein